jgi:hypothetical protein
LSDDQRRALTAALAGQYKFSGVDLVGDEAAPIDENTRLPFRDGSITWEQWVELWENDQAGKAPTAPVPAVHLLPELAEEAVAQNA